MPALKDVSTKLRTAYYSRLDGAITVGTPAVVVNVFDQVIENPVDESGSQVNYWITLGDFSAVESGTKDTFAQIVLTEVKCLRVYAGDFGGKKDVDSMTDQVVQLIRTRSDGYLTLTGHTIVTTTMDNTFTEGPTQTPRGTLYARTTTFRHIIYQTN